LLFVITSCLLAPRCVALPQQTASLRGTVTDQTGAVVAGATVSASGGPGVNLTTTSDAQGNYKFTGLQAGKYEVKATAPGFKEFRTDNLTLTDAQELTLDVTLEPGADSTNVTVQERSASQVETETSEVSGTITQKEIVSLGLNGRNFTQLITLAPGVSNQTGQDEAKVGVLGSAKYSVNGGRVEYNSFEVDGSDVQNAGINASRGQPVLTVYPSVDALSEVKVLTSNYGAMYGKSASGTVQATTKSGTTSFHGNLYEFVRNEIFNSRNYFDPVGSTPKYRRNDFGGTIGGPFFIPGIYDRKNSKSYFFFSEEVRREISPPDFPFAQGVPSNAERAGIFNDVCPTSGPVGTNGGFIFKQSAYPDCPIYNVTGNGQTVVGYPGNTIPITNFAKAILNTGLIPQPNSTTGCNSTIGSCYVVTPSLPTNWHEEITRFDQDLSSKVHLMGRYIHDSWNATIPTPWNGFLQSSGYTQNSFPTVLNNFEGPGVDATVQLSWTISPKMLNQTSFAYTSESITLSGAPGIGVSSLARPSILDAPCTTPDPVTGYADCPMGVLFNNGFGGKIPGIVIGGSNAAYGGSGFAVDTGYTPWTYSNPTYQFRDTFSISAGKHTWQFGAQAYLGQQNELSAATGANTGDVQGILFYNNVSSPFTTGNAFADFLIGPVNAQGQTQNHSGIQKFEQDSTHRKYYNRYTVVEPYVQDDWKVTPRLTVNLGLRVSLYGLWHEKYNNAYNYNQAAYSQAIASTVLVNPMTGQLVSSQTLQPIPLDLNNLNPAITNGLVRCGTGGVPSGCMKGHVFNPAPRIGFAWDPTGSGKTSIRAGYGIFYEHGTSYEANTGSLIGSAPLVITMTQNAPFTLNCINGGRGQTGCGPGGAFPINVAAIPRKMQWPYSQQWSFSIERQLSQTFVGTVGYVGSKGTHLAVEGNANQLAPVLPGQNPFAPGQPISHAICQTYNGGSFQVGNTTVTNTQQAFVNLLAACFGELPGTFSVDPNSLRQVAPGIGQIYSILNAANSTYNAFQATVRSTRGPVNLIAAYSYSHSIDSASDRADATFVNLQDLAANRASSSFDQRHLLSIGYVVQDPFLALGRFYNSIFNGPPCGDCQSSSIRPWRHHTGEHAYGGPRAPDGSDDDQPPSAANNFEVDDPGKPSFLPGLLREVFSGWEWSGVTTIQSGTPFSVINQGSGAIGVLDNAGIANGLQYGSYPDLIRGAPMPYIYNPGSFGPLLGNPAEFAAPQGLTLGNAGRNFLNNPGRTNFDMALLKTWHVWNERVLQFRVEAFNVFNHTQFNIYDPLKGNTGSNVINCYGPASTGFSAAGGDGTNCLLGSSFLHPVDAHQPRTMQLGAKFSF
jgi:hypothetical protein